MKTTRKGKIRNILNVIIWFGITSDILFVTYLLINAITEGLL